ncbi:hypothetical protein AVEN_148676-1 [Araneus ventricosus]|uniref:Retrovirus-related Pol polyprotein from transposon 17.6 n=1 Tax=Araneus ventricosus TaxID=182803 RepID=A0A4Y2G9R6_ARAVE|nr:hypothetical protein AVEN_148676-1 [Araneus ventricosus]
MGKLSTFDVNDIMSPSESDIYQINTLNLNEIHKMRRDELLRSDFKLDHLNDKDKKDIQELLLKYFKVFSKSYKTLGETSAVTQEFSLLHNFPLQTKPYSIPLIANKYAQQEINNLLEAGIIEPSSSSYCFPVIFIKKKQNPNDSNSEPKFRMVVDYRLLNSITETFKICLPKISEIIKNIAGVTEEDILSEITNEREYDGDDDTDPSQSLLTSQEALQSVQSLWAFFQAFRPQMMIIFVY